MSFRVIHNISLVLLGILALGQHLTKAQDLYATIELTDPTLTPGKRITLSGSILDSQEKAPVMFALVEIEETGNSTLTDMKGLFSFSRLHPGNYHLTISAVGFQTINCLISAKTDTTIRLTMNFGATELPEAIVAIHSHEEDDSHQGISNKELDKHTGEGLGEILENIPGVTTFSTGSGISKPVIHGMHSNRVVIMNNGLRHESQRWGNEHAPEIDPFTAEDLTVIKGAQGLKYGSDAIAGVVLVNPRSLRTKFGTNAKVHLAGASNGRMGATSLMLEGKHRLFVPLSWRIQGTLKRSGNTHTPDYFLSNTGLAERNFSLATGYKNKDISIDAFYSQFNTNIGIYQGSHIGNLTDLNKVLAGETLPQPDSFTYDINRPYQNIEHELTKVHLAYYFSDNTKISITYGRQVNLRKEFDNDTPLNDSIAALNRPDLQFGLTTHNGEVLLENHKGTENRSFGIGYKNLQSTAGGSFFIPNSLSQNFHVFLLDSWSNKDWKASAGLRYELQKLDIFMVEDGRIISPRHQFSHFAGQGSVGYTLNDKSKVDFQTGYAWRPPAVVELYANGLHHGSAAIEVGDRNLNIERVINTSLNFHHQRKRLDLEVSLFYNFLPNFIYAKPTGELALTIRGAFPTYNYVNTKAQFYGTDLFFKYKLTEHLSILNKSNITLAKDLTNKSFLVGISPARTRTEIEYKIDGKGLFETFHLSGNVLLVAKQNRISENSDFAPPPSGYILFGIASDFDLDIRGYAFGLSIGVDNLLNEKYRDYMNRLRYFSDELGRNFFIRTTLPLNF